MLKVATCLKGERSCPPEDSGGIWGYMEQLEVLSDPEYPEYEDCLDWLGDDFDPEHSDLEVTNSTLYGYCQRRKTRGLFLVVAGLLNGMGPCNIFQTF